MTKTTVEKSNLRVLRAQMSDAARGLSRVLADAVVDEAKKRVKVRTGHTRSTIKRIGVNQYRNDVEVGGGGPYLEFGTSRMPPQPFLIPAFEWIKNDLITHPRKYLRRFKAFQQ